MAAVRKVEDVEEDQVAEDQVAEDQAADLAVAVDQVPLEAALVVEPVVADSVDVRGEDSAVTVASILRP